MILAQLISKGDIMGLFKFVTDTGSKLFGGKTSDEANQEREQKIQGFVTKFELPVSNFGVKVKGEEATLMGESTDQPTREKVVLAVGNIEGIGQVNDQMTIKAAQTTPPATFYTVKSGDTLSKIAKSHYGDAQTYTQIFEANKPMLSHPDKIYPGQTLRIPNTDKIS